MAALASDKLSEDLHVAIPLSTFKQARLFDPSKVADIQPTAGDIEDLRIFSISKL